MSSSPFRLAVCALVFAISCSDATAPPRESPGDADVSVAVNLAGAPQIAAVHLLVSAADIPDTLRFALVLESGVARGTARVPAGTQRTFILRAVDDHGVTVYEGSTVADVIAGLNPPLTVIMLPVDPDGVVPIVGHIGVWTLTVEPAVDTLRVGEWGIFKATVRDPVGNVVDTLQLGWNINDVSVGSVAGGGSVLATGPGATQVLVHYSDLKLRATVEVVVIE